VDLSDTGVVVGSSYDYAASGATKAPSPSGPGVFTWTCTPLTGRVLNRDRLAFTSPGGSPASSRASEPAR
jgi:hypothetical protein